jgi:hypothetical protein
VTEKKSSEPRVSVDVGYSWSFRDISRWPSSYVLTERMRSPLDAENYRWSSHGAYVGKDNLVKIDCSGLGGVAKSLGKARLGYLRFMPLSYAEA